MDIDNTIANNIAQYFEDNDLSPIGEAQKIKNIGKTVIRDIITRKTRSPTYSSLSKIAAHFGLTVAELVTYPKNIDPNSQDAQILDLWYRLDPNERNLLLNVGEAHISTRAASHDESDEDG